jgi:hypothetical protein
MSSSDLAPFVLAVLRDKVLADQVEEIRLLQRKLSVFNRIAIMSSSGATYVEARMEDGYEANCTKWSIDLTKKKPQSCSFRQFAMSELHLNGIRLGEIVRDCLDGYAENFLYAEGRGEIEIFFLTGIVLNVSIGPIALVDFQRLQHENIDSELFVQLLFDGLLFPDFTLQMNVQFRSISFAGGIAKGALGAVDRSV